MNYNEIDVVRLDRLKGEKFRLFLFKWICEVLFSMKIMESEFFMNHSGQ